MTTDLNLAVLEGAGEKEQKGVRETYDRSLDELREFASVEEISLPDLPYSSVTGIVIDAESAAAFETLVESGDVAELEAPSSQLGGYSQQVVLAKDYVKAMRIRTKIQEQVDEALSPYDAVVTPTRQTVANPIETPLGEYFGQFGGPSISATANIAGLPGVTVPTGSASVAFQPVWRSRDGRFRTFPFSKSHGSTSPARTSSITVRCWGRSQPISNWSMKHPRTRVSSPENFTNADNRASILLKGRPVPSTVSCDKTLRANQKVTMSTPRHPTHDATTRPGDEHYAVVVITKAEGMEVVLHGLQRRRAERIAARKNRNRDETTNVQPVREQELEQLENQLKHPDD